MRVPEDKLKSLGDVLPEEAFQSVYARGALSATGAIARKMINGEHGEVWMNWHPKEADRGAFETLICATRSVGTCFIVAVRDGLLHPSGCNIYMQKQVNATPDAITKRAMLACSRGQKVGFLFGSEKFGLRTEELRHANYMVSIPAQPGYNVLNLSQAVLVMAYQLSLARGEVEATGFAPFALDADDAGDSTASLEKIEALLQELKRTLEHSSRPSKKSPAVDPTRDVLLRARPSVSELNSLWGMLKRLSPSRSPEDEAGVDRS
ncbi:unnamed protein product [Polarella glacialis]|uniref:tRNA/rRNA methyltransferase SpoU type domain-containing protein n=1 Tax=Polarella glacialis TaxID=89957 RepID=A0A813KI27_POLGL|nr:unnamed protein product [Polarella glacialis]